MSHLGTWVMFGVSVFIGCSSITDPNPINDNPNDSLYVPAKIFGDSTYVHRKDTYKIGERIYVITREPTMAAGWPDTLPIPDTVKILIVSSFGDTETILATSNIPVDTDGMTRVYGGFINSKDSLFPNNENDTLEVNPSGDSILAYYTEILFGGVVIDTAQVVP